MKTLTDSQVLVTGATGFLGSRLSEILASEEGAKVTATGRDLDRVSYLKDLGVSLKQADLLDTGSLKDLVEGKEVIFHSAAALSADPETAQKVNVDATAELVRLAGEAGVTRFVHVSTVGVYDMSDTDEVIESTPLATGHSSVYPRTKALAEVEARKAAEKLGIELAIVRPSMIYGPGHGIWSEGMFQNVVNGNPVMLGDGSTHFNPVYIDDVVNAMILCAKHPDAAGEAFNISAEITTWHNFMSHYAKLSGKQLKKVPIIIARIMAFANKVPGISTPVDQGFIEMATSYKSFPVGKAEKKIGWNAQVPFEEGMNRTIAWIKSELL